MRVRVLEKTKAYWNYAVQEWQKGEELLGDLARHLASNAPAGHIEVLEADPEPEPDPGPADPPPPPPDEPPVDGTIDTLMAWVGDDPDRTAAALHAEQAKDKPRSTVVKRLTAALEDQPAPKGDTPPAGDEPPIDGTVDTLMAWVGDDPDRAQAALAAEQAKDEPRVTVIKALGGDPEQ